MTTCCLDCVKQVNAQNIKRKFLLALLDQAMLLIEDLYYLNVFCTMFFYKKIPIIISVYLTPYLLHMGLICRGSFTFC